MRRAVVCASTCDEKFGLERSFSLEKGVITLENFWVRSVILVREKRVCVREGIHVGEGRVCVKMHVFA